MLHIAYVFGMILDMAMICPLSFLKHFPLMAHRNLKPHVKLRVQGQHNVSTHCLHIPRQGILRSLGHRPEKESVTAMMRETDVGRYGIVGISEIVMYKRELQSSLKCVACNT